MGEYHKYKKYRDEDWAIKVKEHNFFLLFTDAFKTNTILIESQKDKADCKHMECKYGECIHWMEATLHMEMN